jgi:DNA helicase-2/ATP-dependent DNA helicase PcrA
MEFEGVSRPGGRSLMGGGFEKPFTGGLNRSLGTNSPLKSLKDVTGQPSRDTSGSIDVIVGNNVEHDRFGKGKVTKIEGTGPDKKATIFFPHHGTKTVLLRFANLKIID